MGFLNPSQDDDYRIDAMPGTTEVPAAGALEGALSAIPKGVTAGVAKMSQLEQDFFGSDIGHGVSYLLPFGGMVRDLEADPKAREQWSAATKVAADWAATGQDPRKTGVVGRIAAGTAEGLTIGAAGAAVAGPWGAAGLLGGTEGYSTYKDSRAQGVDAETAKDQAIATGIFSAAQTLLPMKFGSNAVTSAAGGAALNVTLGAAQRGLTADLLRRNGYTEMADQYKVMDHEAMLSDLILGGAFGVMGHYSHAAAQRVNPADVDAAAAVATEDHFNRSAPGVPTDPATATVHADTMADALRTMADGGLPDVPPDRAQQLVDNVLPDPTHDMAPPVHEAAMEDLPGFAAATAEVPRVELPPEEVPPPKPEPAPAPAGEPAKEPDVPLDDYHASALDHLVHNYGDETYLTDDGREVTYRQMANEMQKQRNEADSFAKLHDVAAACAARNGV